MYERPVCKSRSIVIFISSYEQGKAKFQAFQKKGLDIRYLCTLLRCIAWYSLSNIWAGDDCTRNFE